MQPLNFIHLSSKKHKAVRQWFLFSSVLIGILLGVCVYFSVKQWKRYKNAQRTTTTLLVQPKQKNNKKNVHKHEVTHLLKTVHSKLTKSSQLESFTLTDTIIEFKIAGTTTKTISDIFQQLKAFNDQIQLAGLEHPTKNRVIGVFSYFDTI